VSQIISRLRELFEYRDGALYWKQDRGSQKCKNQKAGCLTGGYLKLRVRELGGAVAAHRVIFAMHHGYFPQEVDHINGNKLDNRIENLRSVSRSQNRMNAGKMRNNRSGCKNVYPHKDKWCVSLRVGKKPFYLGIYKDLELADLVAHMAREKFHGAYAHHGVN
jgi:hypothetical protein